MDRLTRDEVRRHVAAAPEQLYALVSDVTRTPQWSPEVIECRWLDGATGPAPGARFSARNRRRWFRWSNKPLVEVADPGREFTVARTEPGGGTIRWSFRLRPDGDGTELTESYEVVRPVPIGLHVMLRVLFGVRDLRADLHANLQTSLERIARIAEGAPAAPRTGPGQARLQ
jgi:polyketide cyclase/dehydrase/lipid transport protein